MLMLRYGYVLALAVWLGGMLVLGAVVAPSVFQVLPAYAPVAGRALAGAVFGTVLQRFHYVAYASGGVLLVTLVAMALLGPRPRSFAIRAAIIAVMLGVALYSGVIVLGEIDALQRELAAASPATSAADTLVAALPSQLPADDARRVRFDQLHQLSTRLMVINIAGTLLLLFWEAREHAR
jgi:uncharacterized membrane protein